MILSGEDSLRRAICEYLTHYHRERNQQGRGNALIEPDDDIANSREDVRCRERLDGMLRYYHRQAV